MIDHEILVLYGVPAMFAAQLQDSALRRSTLASLRTGIVAGAPCSTELIRAIVERMHVPDLTVSFGMTETMATLHTMRDDPIERRASTVDTPLPHVECQVVDAAGDVVRRGGHGELRTRSYGQMLGYWRNPADTAAVVDRDGWVSTGDLAVIDEAGYVRIVGRLK